MLPSAGEVAIRHLAATGRGLIAGALLLAACGDPPPDEPATDGTLPVSDAVAVGGPEQVTVRGFLIGRSGAVGLCNEMLDSYPPQCGEPRIEVEGLDLAALEAAETLGDRSWIDHAVELEGILEGQVLTVGGDEVP